MAWYDGFLNMFRRRPQTKVEPPKPQPIIVRLSIWSDHGGLVPGAHVAIHPYEYPGQVFDMVGTDPVDGGVRYRVELPPGTTLGWGADIIITADGFKDAIIPVVLSHDHDITLEVADPPIFVPAIHADGPFFRTQDGQPYTVIEATDFRLLKMYLDGEDIFPVLKQRGTTGFNTVRVLGMCRFMFDLNPANYYQFYTHLQDFVEIVGQCGLRVELTVFADTQDVMPDRNTQLNHWANVGNALSGYANVMLELVNENDQHTNGVSDINAFTPIPGIPCSRGSNGAGAAPPRPNMDYETVHWNDIFEWQRKAAHNTMEFAVGGGELPASNAPCVANENTRFPDNCANKGIAYDVGRSCALLIAGSCFHSVSGKSSALWAGVELECATEWAAGAKSVNLDYQRGLYQHRSDLETDRLLRVYSRVLPGIGEEVASIRKDG